MRDKILPYHLRCVRRLESRTASFPLVGTDWIDERVILCPDAIDNSTHGGSTDAMVLPPVDFYGGTPFSVPGAPEETLLMVVNRFWHMSGSCPLVTVNKALMTPGRARL